MPYRVRLSEADAFAAVEFTGDVTWDDLRAALGALTGHPAWRPAFDVVWDARRLGALDVPPEALPAMRATMEAVAPARAGGASAIVAVSDTVATFAVLLSQLGPRTGRIVGSFRDLDEGLRFLGRRAMPEAMETVAEG